jgi:fucose 4-O-acetylase-like acetyltransferase
MRWLAIIGMVLIICGYLFDVIPVHVYPMYNYWFTSPNYFLIRIGSLMVVTAAFWYFAQHIKQPKKVFTVLGIESLFVYVLHLIILYGSAVNPTDNLQVIFGNNLSLLEATGVFFGMFILMIVAASVWNYLKVKHFNLYRIIQLTGGAVFLYFLFTRDF